MSQQKERKEKGKYGEGGDSAVGPEKWTCAAYPGLSGEGDRGSLRDLRGKAGQLISQFKKTTF